MSSERHVASEAEQGSEATPMVARRGQRRPRTSGYTRERQGCLTCRRRKKRCDLAYPVCGHCKRLNFICDRDVPRHFKSSVASAEPFETTKLKFPSWSGSQRLPLTGSNGIDARLYQLLGEPYGAHAQPEHYRDHAFRSRRTLLRYYTTDMAAMLATNHENNCFVSVLLPMAFECSTLMQTLVAWASTHLAQRDESFATLALYHRGAALNQLQAGLKAATISREMRLAITMSLCSMEVIADGTDHWLHHLKGGATALESPTLATMDSGEVRSPLEPGPCSSGTSPYTMLDLTETVEGRWLLKNFAYHDVLMSVSTDRRPLFHGRYWLGTSEDQDQADPYFGLAAEIVFLVGEISCLKADLTDSVDSSSTSGDPSTSASCRAALLRKATEIEIGLMKWEIPAAYHGSCLAKSGEAYRDAALIHLYRTIRRCEPGQLDMMDSKLQQRVQSICDRTSGMIEGCLPECTLLFPLFLAGGEAREFAHMALIREKLRTINRRRMFRNIDVCISVLDELWSSRMAGSKESPRCEPLLDWLDVTRSRGYTLAIT